MFARNLPGICSEFLRKIAPRVTNFFDHYELQGEECGEILVTILRLVFLSKSDNTRVSRGPGRGFLVGVLGEKRASEGQFSFERLSKGGFPLWWCTSALLQARVTREMRVPTSTVAALCPKMASTGQRTAMVDMVTYASFSSISIFIVGFDGARVSLLWRSMLFSSLF